MNEYHKAVDHHTSRNHLLVLKRIEISIKQVSRLSVKFVNDVQKVWAKYFPQKIKGERR